MPPGVGTTVHVAMTKWRRRPHWAYDGLYLGADENGDWVGAPAGTHFARPGYAFDADVDSVTLFAPGVGCTPTFHAPGTWCDLYVDITTPPVWDGHQVGAVDLDLDVIRRSSMERVQPPPGVRAGPGEVFVDDEDEFAEHQVTYGYPAEVVAAARASCARVLRAVRAREAPYDDLTGRRWLARLAQA